MTQQHSFKLIDGKFKPSEARSLLFTLINSKINFHSLESFGITIRTGGDTSFHERRIKELSQTHVDIKKVINYSEEHNLNLKINGVIEIELINEQK